MIRNKIASVVLAGIMFTSGVLVASNWTGTTNLQETQQIVSNFNTKALEYIEQAKLLEALASDQNTDILTLMAHIEKLEELKADLEAQVKDLEKALEDANNSNGETQTALTEEINRLTAELTKANAEIEKANSEVESHKEYIRSILDASIFEELNIPDRVDISGITGAEDEEENTRFNYNLNFIDGIKKVNQEEATAYINANIIPVFESLDLTEAEENNINSISIEAKYNSSETKVIYTVTVKTKTTISSLENKMNSLRNTLVGNGTLYSLTTQATH